MVDTKLLGRLSLQFPNIGSFWLGISSFGKQFFTSKILKTIVEYMIIPLLVRATH